MNDVFPLYRDKTLEGFEPGGNTSLERALAVTFDYVQHLKVMKDEGIGLTFVGENGVGKTHLACCVMGAAKEAGYKIECLDLFTYINLHLEMMRVNGRVQKYGYEEDGERSLYLDSQVRYIRRAQFLLLDDLGREHESESGWSNEQVFSLLRYRHMRKLPTLITTNIPNENDKIDMDLKRRYSEGLSSWVREATIIIKMEGEDYRCGMVR
jgi:DNA replication protein DnaC